jgi:hypothetical protein
VNEVGVAYTDGVAVPVPRRSGDEIDDESGDESDDESLRLRLDRARIESLLASKDESDDESDESDDESGSSDDSSSETVEHQRRLWQADANKADKEATYKQWVGRQPARKKTEAAIKNRRRLVSMAMAARARSHELCSDQRSERS